MFAKDSRQENFLTHIGVTWRYADDLEYKSLAPSWREHNQGRSRAKVEEAIMEYAARMEAGSAAPSPIVRPNSGVLDILDGVQRLSAGELRGYTRFAGYVVETESPLTAVKIRVLANHLLAGHPEANEWNRRQAIQMLVIEGGLSIEEVARAGGWNVKDVQEDKTFLDWQWALKHIGVEEPPCKSILLAIDKHGRLDDLRVAPEPIRDFCKDLKRGKFSNGDAEPYIKDFFVVDRKNRKRLHDQFTKHLDKFHQQSDVVARLEGRGPNRRSGDIKLRGAMKTVLTMVEALETSGEEIAYMEEYFQLWNQVRDGLAKLNKHHARRTAKV